MAYQLKGGFSLRRWEIRVRPDSLDQVPFALYDGQFRLCLASYPARMVSRNSWHYYDLNRPANSDGQQSAFCNRIVQRVEHLVFAEDVPLDQRPLHQVCVYCYQLYVERASQGIPPYGELGFSLPTTPQLTPVAWPPVSADPSPPATPSDATDSSMP